MQSQWSTAALETGAPPPRPRVHAPVGRADSASEGTRTRQPPPTPNLYLTRPSLPLREGLWAPWRHCRADGRQDAEDSALLSRLELRHTLPH